MKQKIALGVDIGGSHVTSQLVDLRTSTPFENSKMRITVDNLASKEEILNSWVVAIKKTAGTYLFEELSGIGFAMPGPFDYPNGIAKFDKNVKKFGRLYGVNIREELRKLLNLHKDYPIRFLNDAASFAVGEAWYGKPSKSDRIIAVTLGTGFGSTFIKNKFPVTGKEGIPDDGFLYHIPFQNSIADDYFSTRWFVREYKGKTGKEVSGVDTLAEIYKTDETVQELFSLFGENLGTFLSPWVKKFNADCIVIGGNIAKSYPLFEDKVKRQFNKNNLNPEVCISTLGESAALIGSARLCDNHFYSKLTESE